LKNPKLLKEMASKVNHISVIDLRTDKEKGGFIIYEPPQAKVKIKRENKDTAKITIQEFISPSVIRRFNLENSLLQKTIKDFRSMIDYVLIDPNYDGKIFRAVIVDIPKTKKDFITGVYTITIPQKETKVAVKIVDVLGNELLCVLTV
jgi:hypothetical protein